MRLASVLALAVIGCGSSHANGGDDTTDGGVLVPPQGCDAQDDDGDGWSNAVEVAMGTSPIDASDNPDTRNEIVFAMPLHGAPRPTAHVIEGAAKLARADVAILLDTTGSMAGTAERIQAQFQQLIATLATEVDDLAFGAAGFGDFPVNDGQNSTYDVPFYLVHRVMTARTAAGKSSVLGALTLHNIISDGLGPWFANMRGGDEPERGWEALRQVALGTGIAYPIPPAGTGAVPPFSSTTAYPTALPPGEERGAIGGMGFRAGSLPIILVITDTTQHADTLSTTTPHSADYPTALAAIKSIGAKVIGVNTYFGTGQADLKKVADATGARVAPEAWGTGADRPANCPVGKCCVIANDQSSGSATQPSPVAGQCSLVFTSDRYDDNLAKILEQAVVGVARGVRLDAGAVMTDDASDDVDAVASFVDRVEAVTDGTCATGHTVDLDGDGIAETFDAVLPGSPICFRITTKVNTTIEPGMTGSRTFRAVLQLTGDGLSDLTAREVWFVVPAAECDGGIIE